MVAVASAGQSFSDRLVRFLNSVSCRRLVTEDDREEAFRLRYDAYVREGTIDRDFSRRFTDDFDRTPNVWIFGLYIDGRLATSIRIHLATRDYPRAPATAIFPDVLMPQIEAGRDIVDSTRFVADYQLARQYPELPYVTARLGFVATEYFGAYMGLAAVRVEHQAFYKRVFYMDPLGEPRPYPNLAKPISLMGVTYENAVRNNIFDRYPYLRSTHQECMELFGPAEKARLFHTEPVPVPAIAGSRHPERRRSAVGTLRAGQAERRARRRADTA